MADVISKIEQILKEELAVYGRICELEEKKGPAIIERELSVLSQLISEQEQHIAGINSLEEERLKQISIYAEKNPAIVPELLTLADITGGRVDKKLSGLSKTGRQLKAVLEKIKEVQQVNESMLNDNIEFYNLLFEGLRDQELSTGAYGSDGKESVRRGGALLFNTRA